MRSRSNLMPSSRSARMVPYKITQRPPFSSSVAGYLLAFLAGCGVTWFLSTTRPSSVSASPALRDNSSTSNCQISLGTYRGPEYRTDTGGTVGQPKCLVESKFLKVQQHSVRIPDDKSGTIIPDWLWIDYHDQINVLIEAEPIPGDTERHFLVFEQTKYALEGRMSLAVVGGIIEPHEDPEHAARREVEEEMGGLHCERFHFLGRYRADVNRGAGWTSTFLAAQCSKAGPALAAEPGQDKAEQVGAADAEKQQLRRLSLTELKAAVTAGKFLEIKWSATVALALLHPELTS